MQPAAKVKFGIGLAIRRLRWPALFSDVADFVLASADVADQRPAIKSAAPRIDAKRLNLPQLFPPRGFMPAATVAAAALVGIVGHIKWTRAAKSLVRHQAQERRDFSAAASVVNGECAVVEQSIPRPSSQRPQEPHKTKHEQNGRIEVNSIAQV